MKQIAISEIIIIKLIVVGVLLFVGLWILKFAWKNVQVRRTYKTKVDRLIPLIEGVLWLGFSLWCIRQLIRDDFWNSMGVLAVVLLVLVLLSWFVVRDVIAGIIIKSDGSMKLNDWVKVKGIEGEITEMGHRTMVITTDSGETVNIPFSTLSGEISIKPNPSEKLKSHTFEITISKNTDLESTIDQVRMVILNAPWSSVRKSPEIKLLNDSPQAFNFEINIYSIKLIYFQKIKNYLKNRIALLDQ